MKILITGGAGFIGHHIIDYLLRTTDWEIVSLDRLDVSGSLNRIADILDKNPSEKHRIHIVYHDLKAPINDLTASLIGKDVNYIFHLAAGSHVDRSIDYPLEFVMDNMVGTCNILDFARMQCPDLKLFINFSTDEVFGPAPEGVKYKEWDRYNSGNPYSASKAGAAELGLAYGNTYGLPIIITYTMNVMGIRQHPEKYIPLCIHRIYTGEKIYIHSNKDKTEAGKRHYINTEDVASGLMFLVNNGVPQEKYNIVGERELDNLTLAQTIANIMGKPLNYEMLDFHSSRPGHDLRYALDGTKMKELGWMPEKNIIERLEEVIKWSLNNKYWIGLK